MFLLTPARYAPKSSFGAKLFGKKSSDVLCDHSALSETPITFLAYLVT